MFYACSAPQGDSNKLKRAPSWRKKFRGAKDPKVRDGKASTMAVTVEESYPMDGAVSLDGSSEAGDTLPRSTSSRMQQSPGGDTASAKSIDNSSESST